MSGRINIYALLLVAIFLCAAAVTAVILFNSRLWLLDICRQLVNYWVYVVPAVLGAALCISVRQYQKSKQTITSFTYVDNPSVPHLQPHVKHWITRVFESETPQAFTFGFLRPRIYLSTALFQTLGDCELTAILAHEKFHIARKDHVWSVVLCFVKYALFFLPIVYWLYARHRVKIELACDREAARAAGNPHIVAGALLKLKRFSCSRPAAAVVGMSEDNLEERVKTLLGVTTKSCWKRPLLLSLVSLLIFASLTGFAMAQQATICCLRT